MLRPDLEAAAATRTDEAPGRSRIPALLRHHAAFIDVFLQAVCAGTPIAISGRQALAYTAERLRQIAKALT